MNKKVLSRNDKDTLKQMLVKMLKFLRNLRRTQPIIQPQKIIEHQETYKNNQISIRFLYELHKMAEFKKESYIFLICWAGSPNYVHHLILYTTELVFKYKDQTNDILDMLKIRKIVTYQNNMNGLLRIYTSKTTKNQRGYKVQEKKWTKSPMSKMVHF